MSYLTYNPATSSYPIRKWINPNSVISPYANADPFYNNIILDLISEGANNSTNIVDTAGNTISVFGNTKISTAQSKIGGSSIYFDGIGDYLTVPHPHTILFPGDFTLEAWVYTTSSSRQFIFSDRKSDGIISRNVEINLGKINTNYHCSNMISTSNIALSTWTHVAVCGDSSDVRLYINGQLEKTGARTSTGNVSSDAPFCIGEINGLNITFQGYLDGIRGTTAARYTANFNPETDTYLNN